MFVEHSNPPKSVDRLVIHQFDPARPSPGGIDTCLRGIARYFPSEKSLAFVGVDAGADVPGRQVGKWERHNLGGADFWFLPAVRLDPGNQSRLIPHSIRLFLAVVMNWRKLPASEAFHVHRMDMAAAVGLLSARPQVYFVHTQENGLTGKTSDSFWRFFGGLHHVLERRVAKRARAIMVFNDQYAQTVKQWNQRAHFFPTWFDPALIEQEPAHENPNSIIWVGRFEVPKDPELAVAVLEALVSVDPTTPWTLEMLGSGTRFESVALLVERLEPNVKGRITLHGRVGPKQVAQDMARGGVFLMTSHPGYEGFARVLVEAMASGLPAVVTEGSDTGGIVRDGVTGYTCDRNPLNIAQRVISSQKIERSRVSQAVKGFDAPTLVGRIFALSGK